MAWGGLASFVQNVMCTASNSNQLPCKTEIAEKIAPPCHDFQNARPARASASTRRTSLRHPSRKTAGSVSRLKTRKASFSKS